MAKSVYIFGAGASLHVGAPLMNQFIDAADDLRSDGASGIDRTAFDLVFSFIQERLPAIHAKSVVDLDNLESLFSLLEMGRLLGRLPGTAPEEVEGAVAALRTVLVQTLERRCQFRYDAERQWLPSTPYSSIVSSIAEQANAGRRQSVAFITFNYDLAFDFALHWHDLPIDYGLVSSHPQAAVPLLKLHGSLNWLLCPGCNEPIVVPMETIFRAQPRVRGPGPGKRQLLVTTALSNQPAHCADAKHNGQPALVPPSWNKTQYHERFGRVWRRAAAELADAHEVVVAGYSLPSSDAFFRDLLALSFAGPNRLRKFAVINPDRTVLDRFKQLLGPDARGRFEPHEKTFEDWASGQYGSSPRILAL